VRLLGKFLLVTAFFNTLALAAPVYYMKHHGWLNAGMEDLAVLYVAAVASSSLLCVTALYILVVWPVENITKQMSNLCEGVSIKQILPGRKDEIGMLGAGLFCMAGQWEKSKTRLEEAARDELRKVEKLATIGEMAYSIAHDIKNPLAGISGAIQVFAEEFPEDDHRREIVHEVLGEIERLDRSVKDLLCYARPPEPHPIPTPVDGLIEGAVSGMAESAKNGLVDVNILRGGDMVVNVDPEQMHQALMNIMSFSLGSMPAGGSLNIYVRQPNDMDSVEIILKDTGAGLDGSSMTNLFKPFRTSRISGTGLSLAISRIFIERHGGDIEVESSLGVGTTFKVTLPSYKGNA